MTTKLEEKKPLTEAEKNIASMKWYMVTTISGKEWKVKESLENRIISESLENNISDIFIATNESLTPKGKIKVKNIYPGYIFIKMHMSDRAWFIVRNTQYVTGLVGSSGQRTQPTPVSKEEINRIFKQSSQSSDMANIKINFIIGDPVKVIAGALAGNSGVVTNITKTHCVVDIEIFGRLTPSEIKLNDVEKI